MSGDPEVLIAGSRWMRSGRQVVLYGLRPPGLAVKTAASQAADGEFDSPGGHTNYIFYKDP